LKRQEQNSQTHYPSNSSFPADAAHDDRALVPEIERFAHLGQIRCARSPEMVGGNDERDVARLEVVDGRETIVDTAQATVVVVLDDTLLASSMPTLAVVMDASVVSGGISDRIATIVVLPTPKPPEMMAGAYSF
jgi:hypothetical protein